MQEIELLSATFRHWVHPLNLISKNIVRLWSLILIYRLVTVISGKAIFGKAIYSKAIYGKAIYDKTISGKAIYGK